MKAVDYLKTRGRMTKNCNISCGMCPLDYNNNKKDTVCSKFENNYPEEAVEIVENWAKEHPVKTYLSVLLEKLPNVKLVENGTPKNLCPKDIFRITEDKCSTEKCVECWNREYKEEE